MWMLSTKMLPAVGVLMPIYILSQKLGLLDTRIVLEVIYAMVNLPIIMLILFNYFREIPKEILEASRMDGTSTYAEITQIVMPLAWGGIDPCLRTDRCLWLAVSETTGAGPDIWSREMNPAPTDLTGKVAVVTGAVGGIGDAALRHLAALGARFDHQSGQPGRPPQRGACCALLRHQGGRHQLYAIGSAGVGAPQDPRQCDFTRRDQHADVGGCGRAVREIRRQGTGTKETRSRRGCSAGIYGQPCGCGAGCVFSGHGSIILYHRPDAERRRRQCAAVI